MSSPCANAWSKRRRIFRKRLGEVDAELAGVNQNGTPRSTQTPDAAKESALLARMNEILNRRSYIRNLVASVQKELA